MAFGRTIAAFVIALAVFAISLPSVALTSLQNKVVTAVFQNPSTHAVEYFYIQGLGRDYSGIKVVPGISADVSAGDVVNVSGELSGVPASPEEFLTATSVQKTGNAGLPRPVSLTQKSLAGGASGLQPALCPDIRNLTSRGSGINLVGTRVRVSGKVTWSGTENGRFVCFLDDGSGIHSSTAHTGLKLVYWNSSPDLWPNGTFVTVTGILGAEMFGVNTPIPVLKMDPTPPDTPVVVDAGASTADTSRLFAVWSSCDRESDIVEYQYAVGTTPSDTGSGYTVPWTSAGMKTSVELNGLSLSTGSTYYFYVRARNEANLWSEKGISDGIAIDSNASGIVLLSDNRGDYQSTNFQIPAFCKYEMTFAVNGIGVPYVDYNPFNPNTTDLSTDYWNKRGVLVNAVLTSPDGKTITYPCFWYEDIDGNACWKLRFSPNIAGNWSVKIQVSHSAGSFESASYTFACIKGTRKGFIRISSIDKRQFEFWDGAKSVPYYPIGFGLTGYSGTTFSGIAATCFPSFQSNGANFSRIFSGITMLELAQNAPTVGILNDYREVYSDGTRKMDRALTIDQVIDEAHDYGVYLEWCVDDWTYLKEEISGGVQYTHNQYVTNQRDGRPGPCASISEFWDGVNGAREIYKRKLRYWMARWGWADSLMCIELVNENYGTPKSLDWHRDMARFLHGDKSAIPTSWNTAQDLDAQPKLVSSSNGSTELRDYDIPWADSGMDFVNNHDYCRESIYWSIKANNGYNLRKFGSTLDKPWKDTAVWVDRVADLMHKQYAGANSGWIKPLVWSELGLGMSDWNEAYAADTTARHYRDLIWAGVFANTYASYWKLDYMRGYGIYSAGGAKFWVVKPLSNYLVGEDLRGLSQATTYPGVLNNVIDCTNDSIQAMALSGTNRAYIYVKNTTDTWYYHLIGPTGVPVPSVQSGIVKIKGLQPGRYTLEKWGTYNTDPTAQKKSQEVVTVGSNGILEINVTVGIQDNDSDNRYDWAYKLKPCKQ